MVPVYRHPRRHLLPLAILTNVHEIRGRALCDLG